MSIEVIIASMGVTLAYAGPLVPWDDLRSDVAQPPSRNGSLRGTYSLTAGHRLAISRGIRNLGRERMRAMRRNGASFNWRKE